MNQSQFDKLPPHDIDAEMCLIASLMIEPEPAVAFAETTAIVKRDSFYLADHQIIFDALVELHRTKQPIDSVAVKAHLQRENLYEEVGGIAYMSAILDRLPSSAHYLHYAGIVAGKHAMRELLRICNQGIRTAYAPSDAVTDLDAAREALGKVAAEASRAMQAGAAPKMHALSALMAEVLETRYAGNPRVQPTGFASLDDIIGGLQYGKTHIVGAQPGVGKTAFLKAIARRLAGNGIPVGFITIEEERRKIAVNLLSGESGVINNRIARATASADEWDRVSYAAQAMADLPITVVDSEYKLSSIVAMAHQLVAQKGCKCIIVDHIHIIDAEAQKDRSREQEIAKISKALKQTWRDLDVIGLEAGQVTLSNERERPTPANLRDSRSLFADGDVIMMLFRNDYVNRDDEHHARDFILEVIVGKSKESATGTAKLYYDESRYLICDQVDGRPVGVQCEPDYDMLEGAFR